MTLHIRDSIDNIIMKGGFVSRNLTWYIEKLSEIRHPRSIERELDEAFADIEKQRGTVHPDNKKAAYNCLDAIWNRYPKGERELYFTGVTQQIENGVKVTKTLSNG